MNVCGRDHPPRLFLTMQSEVDGWEDSNIPVRGQYLNTKTLAYDAMFINLRQCILRMHWNKLLAKQSKSNWIFFLKFRFNMQIESLSYQSSLQMLLSFISKRLWWSITIILDNDGVIFPRKVTWHSNMKFWNRRNPVDVGVFLLPADVDVFLLPDNVAYFYYHTLWTLVCYQLM